MRQYANNRIVPLAAQYSRVASCRANAECLFVLPACVKRRFSSLEKLRDKLHGLLLIMPHLRLSSDVTFAAIALDVELHFSDKIIKVLYIKLNQCCLPMSHLVVFLAFS